MDKLKYKIISLNNKLLYIYICYFLHTFPLATLLQIHLDNESFEIFILTLICNTVLYLIIQ